MQDLTKYNSKKFAISRFFHELKVELFLVYQLGNADTSTDKDIDLIIGKRRKLPLCLVRINRDSDVYMMVKDNDNIIAFDKLVITKDTDSQKEMIDIEGYLHDKKYQYAQLDSKKYARERAKKKVFVSCEINLYGEFSAHHSWLDIDVYSVRTTFLPKACMIGENNVSLICGMSFLDKIVDIFRELTKEKKQWDVKSFTEFLETLLMCENGKVYTETAEIEVFSYASQLKITRMFAEGDYSFTVSKHRGDDEKTKNELQVVSRVFYSIMQASSLEECKRIEAKTKLLYGDIHM